MKAIGYVLTADSYSIRIFVWSDEARQITELHKERDRLEETGSTDALVRPVFLADEGEG